LIYLVNKKHFLCDELTCLSEEDSFILVDNYSHVDVQENTRGM